MDTWFAGYQPTLAAVVWLGYDNAAQAGQQCETGGCVSLPIWINFMEAALKGVPVADVPSPLKAWSTSGGEWYYAEYAHGSA
jgi:penicillin-binding protein 1A